MPTRVSKSAPAPLARRLAREAEVQYRDLFNTVPVGLYRASIDGRFLDVNPAMVEIFGFPDSKSLLAVNMNDLFVDAEEHRSWLETLSGRRTAYNSERRILRFDGSVIWVSDTTRVDQNTDGNLYYKGCIKEITAIKQAMEELRRTHDRMSTLIHASPLAVINLDLRGNVLLWNSSAEKIFGWPEQEVLGLPIPVVHQDKWSDFVYHLRRLEQGETLKDIEIMAMKKDGSPVAISLSAGPIRDERDSICGVIGILDDISERKKMGKERAPGDGIEVPVSGGG